jgi:hypothetical protein
LAAANCLQLYDTDAAIADHVRRSNPAVDPLITAFVAMSMDERWVQRSPQEMLATFPWFRGEGFDRIIEDVAALPSEPSVLVEGFRVLPRLVAPLLSQRQQAIWLIPTRAFRRAAFEARGTLQAIAARTSDPARGLANLLVRDALFTDEVARQAMELDLELIQVDVGEPAESLIGRVADSLGLVPR